MTPLHCHECGKKLAEARGSYRISVNCPRCKRIISFESERPAIEPLQRLLENHFAPDGRRANKSHHAERA